MSDFVYVGSGPVARACLEGRSVLRPRSTWTCGCSFRVHSGLPPREDRASNLAGPVRDIKGHVGRRRLFARRR